MDWLLRQQTNSTRAIPWTRVPGFFPQWLPYSNFPERKSLGKKLKGGLIDELGRLEETPWKWEYETNAITRIVEHEFSDIRLRVDRRDA